MNLRGCEGYYVEVSRMPFEIANWSKENQASSGVSMCALYLKRLLHEVIKTAG